MLTLNNRYRCQIQYDPKELIQRYNRYDVLHQLLLLIFRFVRINEHFQAMKHHLLLFALALLSFNGFTQDTITLRDNSQLIGRVVEISETSIKYYRADQPEGPLRVIDLVSVSKIKYNDGTIENFVIIKEDKGNVTKEVEAPMRPERVKRVRDPLFGQGLFIELIPGACIETAYAYQENYFGTSFRIGNKWYFGNNPTYRAGIQATWLRMGMYGRDVNFANETSAYFSILNLGFANVIGFNESRGMEVNLNVGPTILEIDAFPPNPFSSEFGLLTGLEVKYRLNQLAVGLDYARIEEFSSKSKHLIGISIGVKF